MAQDNYNLYDMDDLEDAQGSDLVKKLRAKIDEMSKFAKELEKENASLKASERKRSVASVLESKGYNPKIAAFIPSDLDPTDENLTDWLTEYGDVFGGPELGQEQDASEQPQIQHQIHAQQRIAAAEGNFQSPITPDVFARIEEAQSEEELMAILRGA